MVVTNNIFGLAPRLVLGSLVVAAALSTTEVMGARSGDQQSDDALIGALDRPWKGDLDGMLERRVIRALVIQSQILYFEEKSKPRGAAYELLTEFEKHINKKYPPKVKHLDTHVVMVPVSRDQLLPALLEGRGDIAVGALTITPERLDKVDFSLPFVRNVKEIIVTGPASPKLKSTEDLSGKRILVRASSSYWEHLQRLNKRLAAQGKPPVELDAAPEVLEDEDLMEMINAGLGEVIVVDDYKADLWAKVFPSITLHRDIVINDGGKIAWSFRKNSPKLEAEVNAFAKEHRQGTLLGNILINRYVKNDRFVRNATSPRELERFARVVDLFRKYGGKYDLDHLLVMAQGYQESRLDHSVRSPVGAIGVMQLMPATGNEMQVGDIKELENNVHAGAKYLRFIIDRYFSDESIDELNKMLFGFAAYNAGPARVRGLRKTANESGLDSNRWFDNVEVIAAKKIGSETVTYVSNIYKYYVAYKLLGEERERRRAAKERLTGPN